MESISNFKEKISLEAKTGHNKSSYTPTVKHLPRWQLYLAFLLPILLYANTFSHQYALDDSIVITDNQFVQKGFSGIADILSHDSFVGYFGKQKNLVAGGRYRPLSLLTFAVEHEFFGNNPEFSHFINVLIYAISCLLLLLFISRFLQLLNISDILKWHLPLLATLIFVVHPVHSEAVANIKGRDELMALLFILFALLKLVQWIKAENRKILYFSGIFFFFALLSKESAYPFLLLFPAIMYFTERQNIKGIVASGLPFIAAASAALILRFWAIGATPISGNSDLMNNPFVLAVGSQKAGTIAFTMLKYLQLWIFPLHLTNDYYPFQIAYHRLIDPMALTAIVLYAMMLLGGIIGFIKRKLFPAFLLLYCIAMLPVSNIFFPVGTFMNERFLYIPSMALAIASAWLLMRLGQLVYKNTWSSAWWSYWKNMPLAALIVFAMLSMLALKTVKRNPDWKNNQTLFLHDINISSESAKANNAAGGMLYDMAQQNPDKQNARLQYNQSKTYLEKAVKIYPAYAAAWTTLGNDYYYLNHNYKKAITAYLKAGSPVALKNLEGMGNMALQQKEYQGAIASFKALSNTNKKNEYYLLKLGMAYLQAKQVDSAIAYYNRIILLNPENDQAWVKKGLAYARDLNRPEKGLEFFLKAITINPENAEALENAAIIYAGQDNFEQAIIYFKKALQIHPNDKNLLRNIGNLYLQKGQNKEANTYFQRAGL